MSSYFLQNSIIKQAQILVCTKPRTSLDVTTAAITTKFPNTKVAGTRSAIFQVNWIYAFPTNKKVEKEYVERKFK